MMMKKRLLPLLLALVLIVSNTPVVSHAAPEDDPPEQRNDSSDADSPVSDPQSDPGQESGLAALLQSEDFTIAFTAPEVNDDSFYWTGSAIRPDFTLTYNSEVWIPGIDYRITEYNNNTEVSTADSKARITIEGLGEYGGTAEISFTILPVPLTAEDADGNMGHTDSVELQVKNPVYTGADTVRPEIAIVYNAAGKDPLTLVPDKDYRIEYTDVSSTGGHYTITYLGHFKGSYENTYVTDPIILDDAADVTVSFNSLPYKADNYSPEDFHISVQADGMKLVEGTDYTIEPEDLEIKDAGKYILTITAVDSDTSNKFTGTYDIEVEVTAVDLSESSPDVSFHYTDPGTAVYNGTKIALPVTVDSEGLSNINLTYRAGEEEIAAVYDTDYTVLSSKSNINAGTATAIIGAANGNFYGQREVTFEIKPFTLTAANSEIEVYGDLEYSGIPIEPYVTVKADLDSNDATPKTALRPGDYVIEYENNTAVGTGTVTVKGAGSSGKGNYTGTLTKNFLITKNITAFEEAEVTVEPLTYTGAALTPVIHASVTMGSQNLELVQGADFDVTSIKKNNSILLAQIIDAGSYTLELTGKGNYSGTVLTSVTVAKSDLAQCLQSGNLTITFDDYDSANEGISYYTYRNGTAIEPEITVSIGEIDVADDEYKVTYKNNRNLGTATATIIGLGKNVVGQASATFQIGKDIRSAIVTMVDDDPSYVFTGGEITPPVQVTAGATALTEGKDYLVSYAGNVQVGTDTATVIITGIGEYAGVNLNAAYFSITSLETVTEAEVTIFIDGESIMDGNYIAHYTGSEIKVESVQLNGHVLDPNDYIISYSNAKDIGGATIELTWAEKDIVAPGTITRSFLIRKRLSNAVIKENVDPATLAPVVPDTSTSEISEDGSRPDSAESDSEPATAESDNRPEIAAKLYAAAPIEPKFDIAFAGEPLLTEDEDYMITYRDNTDAGEATVIISAKNTDIYGGSVELNFEIVPRSLVNVRIDPIPDQTYVDDETEITPDVTVSYSGQVLIRDVDYEVDYEDNDEAGTATVIISPASDNYEDEAEGTFTILPRSIKDATVYVPNAYYTGEELEPEATVLLDGVDITDELEYEYTNNIKPGIATVTAISEEESNYTGSVSGDFAIRPQDVKNLEIEKIDDQIYTGKAISPKVRIYNEDTKLKLGTDYTVTYKGNIRPGTASVTIKGEGKYYTGTKKVKFKIVVTKVKTAKATVKANRTLKITARKNTSSGKISGYQIAYRVKGKAIWSKKTVTGEKALSYSLTKLKAGKTYEVKVRAFVKIKGIKKYGAYSKVITTAKIKK